MSKSSSAQKGQVYRKGSKFIRLASGGANPTGHVRNGSVGRYPNEATPVDLTGYRLLEATGPSKPAQKKGAVKKK